MTRPLRIVAADDPLALMALLRDALAGNGDAIMPVPAGTDLSLHRGLPTRVPRRVAVVIETSGSTGVPKRVMLSVDALLAGAAASSVALCALLPAADGGLAAGWTGGQWLLALPAHYIAGVQVLVRSITAGTTPVVLNSARFDPVVFAEHAARLTEPLRFTSLVPVQLARLLDAATADTPAAPQILAVLRRFTAILVGGQAVPPELVQRAEELRLNLVRTYGSSETAGGCVYNGSPIGNTEVRVVDGELQIAGAVLAEGYLGDDERSAARFIEEHGARWYRTGDLGEVDAAGRVRVLGRADNVIISGGEKVSLDQVEAVVRAQPGFADALVLPGDDLVWGQVPVVAVPVVEPVVTRDPALLPALRSAVAAELGRAARPARIVAVPRIPLLASGKPDRLALARLVARFLTETPPTSF